MAKLPSTPTRRKKKMKKSKSSPRRSPRLKDLKRQEIWAVSWRLKKQNRECTWEEVLASLVKSDSRTFPNNGNTRRMVKRWAFSEDTKNKNRGTEALDPKLRKKVLARHADPKVSDEDKTSRNMAAYFTKRKTPISNWTVRSIYIEEGLYPARETRELDLRQDHHRRMRVHWGRTHQKMTEKDWESWVSTDETVIYMQKPLNPRNNVRWVKKGTVRPNPRPMAKHVPSLYAWGAVGGNGQKSKLFIFKNTMTAKFYKDEILKKYALPFYEKVKKDYPDAVMWEDNDPKHTPNEAWVSENFDRFTAKPPVPCRENIQYTGKRGRPKSDPCQVCRCKLPTYLYHAANSADLPPIENIWSLHETKMWKGNPKITTLDQLEKRAQWAWKAITQEEILNIQHSMPARCKAVVKTHGWPIEY